MEDSKSGEDKKTIRENFESEHKVVNEILVNILEAGMKQIDQNTSIITEQMSLPSCSDRGGLHIPEKNVPNLLITTECVLPTCSSRAFENLKPEQNATKELEDTPVAEKIQKPQKILATREHCLCRYSDKATIDKNGKNLSLLSEDILETGVEQKYQNLLPTIECTLPSFFDTATVNSKPERNTTTESGGLLEVCKNQKVQNVLMPIEVSLSSNCCRVAMDKSKPNGTETSLELDVEQKTQTTLITTDPSMCNCSDRATLGNSATNISDKSEEETGVEQDIQNAFITGKHILTSCLDRIAMDKPDKNFIGKAGPAIEGNLPPNSIETSCNNHNNTHNQEEHSEAIFPVPNIVFSACSVVNPNLFDDLEHQIRRPSSHTAPPAYTREEPLDVNAGIHTMTLQRRDPFTGPPPSYSKSLLDRRINPCTSIQFVAPIPPPTYNASDNDLRYHANSGFTLGLGNTWQSQPQPAYCPNCGSVVITRAEIRISRIAHTIAFIMLILLCWPFCILPYFINFLNYTYHFCTVCQSYLGERRPFQRS